MMTRLVLKGRKEGVLTSNLVFGGPWGLRCDGDGAKTLRAEIHPIHLEKGRM